MMAQLIDRKHLKQEMKELLRSAQVSPRGMTCLYLALVLVLLNTYPLLAAQDLLVSSKKDSLRSQAAVMSSALMELESLSADQVARVMNRLDSMGLERILVTDPSGLLLYDSLTQQERSRRSSRPPRNTSMPSFRRWCWPFRAMTSFTRPTRRAPSSPPPPPPSCTAT